MIRNKCAGRKNFHKNHFKNSIISDFFRPRPCWFRQTFRSGPSTSEWRRQTRFWWRFGLPYPSSSWCSPGTTRRQSALTSFSVAEISPLGRYQANGAGSRPFLCFHHLLKSCTEAAACTLEWSLYRNQSWDDNPDLFGIKIARDLVRSFLKHPTSSVILPDFLNYCGDRK